MGLRPKKQVEQVNQIMRCAYLAAAGNAHLAAEELDALDEFRAYAHMLIDARKAIEHFEESGDLQAALEAHPFACILIHDFAEGGVSLFGAVPFPLAEIAKKRQSLTEIEDLLALEKETAAKIKDTYLQKVAVAVCYQVCNADGEVALGEDIAITNLCRHWGISLIETLEWLEDVALPVIEAAPGGGEEAAKEEGSSR